MAGVKNRYAGLRRQDPSFETDTPGLASALDAACTGHGARRIECHTQLARREQRRAERPMAHHRRRAAYLSLLALVGDGQSEAFAGPVAELARVPRVLTLFDARRPIGRDEAAELSAGMLAPSARKERD